MPYLSQIHLPVFVILLRNYPAISACAQGNKDIFSALDIRTGYTCNICEFCNLDY